jgi:hypothetical protein
MPDGTSGYLTGRAHAWIGTSPLPYTVMLYGCTSDCYSKSRPGTSLRFLRVKQ